MFRPAAAAVIERLAQDSQRHRLEPKRRAHGFRSRSCCGFFNAKMIFAPSAIEAARRRPLQT